MKVSLSLSSWALVVVIVSLALLAVPSEAQVCESCDDHCSSPAPQQTANSLRTMGGGSDSDSGSGSGSDSGGDDYMDVGIDASSAKVLYVNIDGPYDTDMIRGYYMLQSHVLQGGGSIDFFNLKSSYSIWGIPHLSSYTQIWIADLSHKDDDSYRHQATYECIADWYGEREEIMGHKPDVIMDGRYLSSVWKRSGGVTIDKECRTWSNDEERPNDRLLANYFYNLHARGGGVVLLTDHSRENDGTVIQQCNSNTYTLGINSLNSLLGLGPFQGCYNDHPWAATVDQSNPLVSEPFHASHHECKGEEFLWDDSSTGVPPLGVQPNGITLYPVAWHGPSPTATGAPAITASFQGVVGLDVSITEPNQCGVSIQLGSDVTISASLGQGSSATWEWFLGDDDTPFSTAAESITYTLSLPGIHRFRVVVTDQFGNTATDSICVGTGSDYRPYTDSAGDLCTVGNHGYGCQCPFSLDSRFTSHPNELNLATTEYDIKTGKLTVEFFEAIKYRRKCYAPDMIIYNAFGQELENAPEACYDLFQWSVVEPSLEDENDCRPRVWTATVDLSRAFDGDNACFYEVFETNNARELLVRFAIRDLETIEVNAGPPDFGGTGEYKDRTIVHYMPFKIVFPTAVVESTGVNVFSPAVASSALLSQIILPPIDESDPTATAKVELYTRVQYPYRLTNPQTTAMAADYEESGWVINAETNAEKGYRCINREGRDCIILFENEFTDIDGVCTFDGWYEVTFDVVCVEGVLDCPAPGAGSEVVVRFLMQSAGNHCPQVVDEVFLDSSLHAYTDPSHTNPLTTFIENDVVYCRAKVVSDAPLKSVVFTSLSLDGQTLLFPIQLINNGLNIAPSEMQFSFQNQVAGTETQTTLYATFQLLADIDSLRVPVDGEASFSLTGQIEVSYEAGFESLSTRTHSFESTMSTNEEGEITLSSSRFKKQGSRSRDEDVKVELTYGQLTKEDNQGEGITTAHYVMGGVSLLALVSFTLAMYVLCKKPKVVTVYKKKKKNKEEKTGASEEEVKPLTNARTSSARDLEGGDVELAERKGKNGSAVQWDEEDGEAPAPPTWIN